MRKLIAPAMAAAFVFSAGGAAGEELLLTCVWDRGGIFELRIGGGVIRNGQKITDAVTVTDGSISWSEASPVATAYEFSINRRNGVLIASAFSKLYDRKIENRGLCAKVESKPQ
jgi:hypothetical protein